MNNDLIYFLFAAGLLMFFSKMFLKNSIEVKALAEVSDLNDKIAKNNKKINAQKNELKEVCEMSDIKQEKIEKLQNDITLLKQKINIAQHENKMLKERMNELYESVNTI